MRDLNIDELEQVYGAGSRGRSGCGDSPTPPSCGSKSKKSKSKKSKTKKGKKSKKKSLKCR
jgi:hypothetical protein